MEYIKGKITSQEKDNYIFESSKIGYKLLGSPKNVKDIAYTQIIVNSRSLTETIYGFATSQEKELFNILNAIKGFGPNSAFKLIMNNSVSKINKARASGNIFALNTAGIKPSLVGLIVDAKNKSHEAELMLIKKTLEKYGFEINKINKAIKNVFKPNLKIDKNILNLIKEINSLT